MMYSSAGGLIVQFFYKNDKIKIFWSKFVQKLDHIVLGLFYCMDAISGRFDSDTVCLLRWRFAEEAHCFAADDDTRESLPRDELI